MIVEVFIEDSSVYYINEYGIKQYLCSKPGVPFKEAKLDPTRSAKLAYAQFEEGKAGVDDLC